MKTAKKLVLAAVVLPLTLGTASAFAFGGKDHKGGHGDCGRSGCDDCERCECRNGGSSDTGDRGRGVRGEKDRCGSGD